MWNKAIINKQNIINYYNNSVLIKMPNKSKYNDFQFWVPSKLIKNGNNEYEKLYLFKDDFTFKLKRYGKGRYNRNKIIEEKEITSEEFKTIFELEENISYLIVEEPKKINEEVFIREELKNE